MYAYAHQYTQPVQITFPVCTQYNICVLEIKCSRNKYRIQVGRNFLLMLCSDWKIDVVPWSAQYDLVCFSAQPVFYITWRLTGSLHVSAAVSMLNSAQLEHFLICMHSDSIREKSLFSKTHSDYKNLNVYGEPFCSKMCSEDLTYCTYTFTLV